MRREPQANLRDAVVPCRLWIPIVLTGVGSGLVGGLLMKLLRVVQHLSFHYRSGDFLHGVEGVSGQHRIMVLVCAGVLAGVVLLLLKLTCKSAADVNYAIWEGKGDFPQLATALRGLLSIVVVGMGAAIGREQALKQGGALVGAKISDRLRLNSRERTLLVACGVGAGMGAAYNVPFGGALFTAEVLLGDLSLANMLPALVTSFVATAVSWLLLPDAPTYLMPRLGNSAWLMLWALLAGPVLGALSAAFAAVIHWGKRNKPRGAWVMLLPIVVFAGLGIASVPFPQILGNGKNIVQLALDWRISTGLLCWLLFLRPLASALVLRAGVPGGLFTPTATFGSVAAAVLGQAWSFVAPTIDKRSYALVGLGAVLAATTQGPISAVAFAMELTYSGWPLIVPLLIAVSTALITFRALGARSIYAPSEQ